MWVQGYEPWASYPSLLLGRKGSHEIYVHVCEAADVHFRLPPLSWILLLLLLLLLLILLHLAYEDMISSCCTCASEFKYDE